MATGPQRDSTRAPPDPPATPRAALPAHSTSTDRLVQAAKARSSSFDRYRTPISPVSPPATRRNRRNAAAAVAPPARAAAPRAPRASAGSSTPLPTSSPNSRHIPPQPTTSEAAGPAGTRSDAASSSPGVESRVGEGEDYDMGGMEPNFGYGADESGFIWAGSPAPNFCEPDAGPSSVELYGTAIFTDRTVLLVRIDHRRWALEDFSKGLPKRGSYVDLFRGLRNGVLSRPHCNCRSAQTDSDCRHAQVMTRYWDQFFNLIMLSDRDDPEAVRLKAFADGFQGTFSVTQHLATISDGKRVIVKWIRNDRWTCASCKAGEQPHSACKHRQRAFAFVTTVLMEEVPMEAPIDDLLERLELLDTDDIEVQDVEDASATASEVRAISYLPIPMPSWAQLAPDPTVPSPASPLRLRLADILASPLPLSSTSRCYACPADDIAFYNPEREAVAVKSVLYTSWGAEDVVVMMQECHCRPKHRLTIGPDLGREYGIFNWREGTLVSHELLDNYSAAMTASATPITAKWTRLTNYYSSHCLPARAFLGKTIFTSVVFAYQLNQTGRKVLGCTPCGPSPRRVIADGVSTGFETKRILASLKPPTVPGGEPCLTARKLSNLAFLKPKARKGALIALQGLQDGNETRVASGVGDLYREGKGVGAGEDVEEEERALSDAFVDQLGRLLEYLGPRDLSPSAIKLYSAFIKALCTSDQAPAFMNYGSVLRTVPIIEALIAGTSTLDQLNDLTRSCPSLGRLLESYRQKAVAIPPVLKQVVLSILRRIHVVHHRLRNNRVTPPTRTFEGEEDSWRGSGACYSLPQVRERPRYPRLESKKRKGGEEGEEITEEDPGDEGCNKYYAQYRKSGKTGGLMVFWCEHGNCLGFHCIPRAEGRNDVFSAILKFWPVAPELIVYDYACSLGAYCSIREADYFKETIFATDQFHKDGHKSCSTSTKFSTYMATDGDLQNLNSSVAECGNSGLARIRKTLSFCSQPNAIIFGRHFLVFWNGMKEVRRTRLQQK